MTLKVTTNSLSDAYTEFKQLGGLIKSRSTSIRDFSANNSLGFDRIRAYYRELNRALNRMDALEAISGMQTFAQEEENDNTYDLSAEYAAFRSAWIAVRDWIATNMIADLDVTVTSASLSTADMTLQELTSAQTGGFRTEINNALAVTD